MNDNMRDFLIHYGIKGQKWGLRRFQNEDGTLTAEGRQKYGYGEGNRRLPSGINRPKPATLKDMLRQGKTPKTRWGRGKKLNDEMYNVQLKKEESLKNKSKEYQNASKEINRLENKYGLNRNMDDYQRAEFKRRFSKQERKAAESRYWEKLQDRDAIESQFTEQAAAHARKTIEKKYGKTALSDIKHFNSVNISAAAGILGAISIAAIVGRANNQRKKNNRAFSSYIKSIDRYGSLFIH